METIEAGSDKIDIDSELLVGDTVRIYYVPYNDFTRDKKVVVSFVIGLINSSKVELCSVYKKNNVHKGNNTYRINVIEDKIDNPVKRIRHVSTLLLEKKYKGYGQW